MLNMYINFCQTLDSNRGPLVLEATALPTEPQPLPKIDFYFSVATIPPFNNNTIWYENIISIVKLILPKLESMV